MRKNQKLQVSKVGSQTSRLVLIVVITCFSILVLSNHGWGFSQDAQLVLPTEQAYTNFIGMKMVRIPRQGSCGEPSRFAMGFGEKNLSQEVTTGKEQFTNGDFDEHPTHQVKITRPFYIGIYEVTNKQYELFDPKHKELRGSRSTGDNDAVINVNWYEARAFCQWLSDKERLPYRLPTEAEWEYACRAGTTTPYYTGQVLPEEVTEKSRASLTVGQTQPNQWGLYDMHGNVEEWCYDWYGPYEAEPQVDPVGRVTGDFRVTRGGSHSTPPYYLRSANRLGTIPEDKHLLIGFRVVLGEMPATKPLPEPSLQPYQIGVNQQIPPDISQGPDHTEPYFHGPRKFIKMPSSDRGPLFDRHNHFISVVECPNGDLLAIWHTCIGESGRELTVAASRLRYGQQEWDPASLFWDAPDRNDHGHALWFDGKDKIYHFQGLAIQARNVALVMRTSSDNGVTWSQPRMIADHGPSRMPVESVFRTKEGFYAISCDKGPNVLWFSRDQGLSWQKSESSIRGKHATAVQLTDGRLMGLGREGNINGKMPMSISDDMGKTWQYLPSKFQPVSWGQRSVLLRLKEGPLFFASFCKKMMVTNASGKQHTVSGLFGAVSLDEGKTWPYQRLATDNGPGREIETMDGDPVTMDAHNTESVGYLTVCQSADGVIHLLTSRQHFAFNLKWLMTAPPAAPAAPTPPKPRQLHTRRHLPNTYTARELLSEDIWGPQISGSKKSGTISPSPQGLLRIDNSRGQGFYFRSDRPDGFAAVEQKKGFTVEIKTQVLKSSTNQRGMDIELYDGAGSRYAITITNTGIYWYEGLVLGSALLNFDQFTPVAEGLDNTDKMHTYRIAVREDRVVQIYRDEKLIGVRPTEYRTPRDAYIQFGAGRGLVTVVEYLAYDLGGAYQP
ncbi:MAG: SUMF1/EgtB/PvdO family nonheme iron enzyme [Planctomycetota bacterium]|jgi:formylglycine-generating enzyme required for sulfatase activity